MGSQELKVAYGFKAGVGDGLMQRIERSKRGLQLEKTNDFELNL